jgi:tetratricopeptide (TPR) repeat protein
MVFLLPLLLYSQQNEDFEFIKPYQRSDIGIYFVDFQPAFPRPGEPVQLELELKNERERPEEGVLVQLFRGSHTLEFQRTGLGPLESKKMSFSLRAPIEEGIQEYYVAIESPNLWSDVERSDNFLNFEISADRPVSRSDLAINGIDLLQEPERPAEIAIEIENHGQEADAAPLEVIINNSTRLVEWVPALDGDATQIVTIPYCADEPVWTVSAVINPRFREMEFQPENNAFYRDFRPNMDLSVEDLSIHAPLFGEDEERAVTVCLSVRNNGRYPVEENIAVLLTSSLFEEDTPGAVVMFEEGIPVGEAVYVSHTFRNMPDAFFIKAVADIHQRVDEADEENNVATAYYQNPTPNVGRWYSIGPSKVIDGLNATGRLYHIAINPKNTQEIYVGAPSGSRGNGCGVWKTKDGGKKWFPITDALNSLMVQALAVDPWYPTRVILGTPHSHQDSCILWESVNGGQSWKKLSTLRANFQGKSILAFDTKVSNQMYLTLSDGVYVSGDYGKKWTRTLNGSVRDLVVDPLKSGNLYVAVQTTLGFEVYQSGSFGKAGTWTSINGCGKNALPAVTQGAIDLGISGSKLFAAYMIDTTFHLYATNGKLCSGSKEQQWEQVHKKYLGTTLAKIEVDPKDANNIYAYWAGPSSIWVSHDGGKNFKIVGGTAPHVDTHGFGFDPVDSKILYVLSDGGIFKSTDRGKDGTWSFIGEGILNSEIYHMAITEEDPEMIIGGTQDNGNISKLSKSNYWKVIKDAGGDGADVEINPVKKTEFYTMHQVVSSLRKHSNGSVKGIGCTMNPCGYYDVFNLYIVPDEPARLLATYNDTLWTANNPVCKDQPNCGKSLWGSKNVWKVLWETPTNAGSIQAIIVDTVTNIFYAGTGSGTVYFSENRGQSWDTASAPGFRSGIYDIAMDPVNTDVFYVSHGRAGANRIRMVRRFYIGNKYSFSASDITFGFPTGLRAESLAVDPKRKYLIYAGTKKGMYKGLSFDGGKTWVWTSFNDGFPKSADVSDLEIYHKTGLLRAATRGRGIYSVRNYHDDLLVKVTPDTKTASPGQTINYTVEVKNLSSQAATFKLLASGLDFFKYGISPDKLSVSPNGSATASLSIMVPACYYSKKWKTVFKVSAHKVKYPAVYGEDQSALVVKVPARQLAKDSYEDNDDFTKAKKLNISAANSKPFASSNPKKISNLTLHSSTDVDIFRIEFTNDSKAECIGKGPVKFGSFMSAFQPNYYPGGLYLSVEEEFCQPMDIAIYFADSSGKKPAGTYGTYKTSNPIQIECPSDAFPSKVLFVKVWRKEGDKVKYKIELNLSDWVITLKGPLYEVGPLRFNEPPFIREWDPTWRFHNFQEEVEMLRDRLQQLREYETIFTEAQVLKMQGDLELAADNRDMAEGLFDRSLEIFSSIGAESAVGHVMRSKARLNATIGRYEEAHELLNQAMELHRATANPEGFSDDLWDLAGLHSERGAFDEALGVFQQLYHQYQAADDPFGQFEALTGIQTIFLSTQNLDGALAGFSLMEKLATSSQNPDLKTGASQQEARLISILGPQNYRQLKPFYAQQAERILQTTFTRLNGGY